MFNTDGVHSSALWAQAGRAPSVTSTLIATRIRFIVSASRKNG
jgi:hypothetical protein